MSLLQFQFWQCRQWASLGLKKASIKNTYFFLQYKFCPLSAVLHLVRHEIHAENQTDTKTNTQIHAH